MPLNRTSLLTEYRLVSRFNGVRERLLAAASAAQLSKPLAFWVLPTDRRLPLAFMSRTLKELLDNSLETLLDTPGVGQKKMVALVALLERAESSLEQAAAARTESSLPAKAACDRGAHDNPPFDPFQVSEATWSKWCESIKHYHLEEETLGRFAASLQNLPRVLWHKPLNAYCNLTLQQIRELRTHGEKRVAAVIEVFHELYNVLAGLGSVGTLAVRVQPRIPGQIENWLLAVLERPELPKPEELSRHLVVPFVEQVRVDLGEGVSHLLEERLGIRGRESSVRQSAESLGLTRARIYQLLGDAADVAGVRWPEGQYLINHLADRIRRGASRSEGYEQFLAMADLAFPVRRAFLDQETSLSGAAISVSHHRQAG